MEPVNTPRLQIATWNHTYANVYSLTELHVHFVEKDAIMTLLTNQRSWLAQFRKSVEARSSYHVHQNRIYNRSIGLIACTWVAQFWLLLFWVQFLLVRDILVALTEWLLWDIRCSDPDKTWVWCCLILLKSGLLSSQLRFVRVCTHVLDMGSFFLLGVCTQVYFSNQSQDIPFQSRPMPKRRACFL